MKGIYREVLELALPAPVDMIVRELTAMSLGMARRKDQEADYRGLLMVYARDLGEYPEDVISSCCEHLRREQKFFPTISEMRNACEKQIEFRRALANEINALMSGKKRLGPPDPRAQMHFKSLPRKDWLPVHYEDWVGDAERMITLMREQSAKRMPMRGR